MKTKLLALAVLAIPLAAGPAAAQSRVDLARGLLASYPLDGDATDEVTNTPAQAFNVRPAEGRDGRPLGALRFDGQRSHVNLGDRLAPARFTVAAWIRADAVGPTQAIVSRIRNAPGHYQRNLELRLDAGGLLFLHVPSGNAWESVQGGRPIQAGRWTHVAATYDGQRAQLYVDGVPDGAPLAVAYQQTRTETFIGARPEGGNPRGPTFFFGGLIADVRVWDRGLSDAEVAVASGRTPPYEPPHGYPGEPPRSPPRPGDGPAQLVSSWPLDRGDLRDAAGGTLGRASGAVRPAEDRRGDPAGALAFTGREYVDAGPVVEPETLTIAAWVRPSRVDREMALVSKLSSAFGPRDRWLELRLERGGRVVLGLPDGGGRGPLVRSSRALVPGRWVHVAATFDGARAVVYVDGQAEGEARLPAFDASRGQLFLAARPDGTGRRARVGTGFEGRLDDVRVYRGALDLLEVMRLADKAPPAPAPYEPPGRPGGPGGPGRGWDDEDEPGTALLVQVGRALVRFDAAVARRDPARIAAAEERALRALDEAAAALRGDRTAGPLVQRIRRTAQELEGLRGRNDSLSLDRKRSALASLSDTLWNDLAHEVDERPF